MSRLISESLKQRIASLPEGPGVYLFKDEAGRPLYIGKAVSIRKRVLSHFRCFGESFSREGAMLAEVRRIDFIETAAEADALLLEASLVKENQPKYNKELKDDKSYPFLKITAEEYPRLLVARGRKPDGSRYFGPYTSVKLLRQAVSMLRRLFPMRTCDPMPEKACLMYHIGQCKAPCEGKIDKEGYHRILKELELFLEGRRDVLIRHLFRRMKEYSARREYEKAKTVYEEIRALSVVPRTDVLKDTGKVLKELKEVLSLPKPPVRIEGFDISNIAGREAVGSLVVFVEGKPARSFYRRFRIKTVEGIDDYGMMREVVRRRYARLLGERGPLPDLIVVDGGKGQLSAAKTELDLLNLSDVPVIGIAKQHEHLFFTGRENPLVLPQSSPVLQVIQRLRDEAHRFAITYHRKLHKREAFASILDQVRGVGPKTKERLLRVFGSVSRMKGLSEGELVRKGGMNPKLAQRLLGALKR